MLPVRSCWRRVAFPDEGGGGGVPRPVDHGGSAQLPHFRSVTTCGGALPMHGVARARGLPRRRGRTSIDGALREGARAELGVHRVVRSASSGLVVCPVPTGLT